MKRKCLRCGAVYDGRPDSTLCPDCAKKSQDSTHWRPRTCRMCGAEFLGGPRAWYCPDCRAKRKKEQSIRYHKDGPKRPIGSTDICPICGKEYTVMSGNQKYCPDCAPKALAAIDREQSKAWNHEHVDIDTRRSDRHAAAAEIPCVICGKLFRPSIGSPVTCSESCAKEYRCRQMSQYEKEHRKELNQKEKERRHNLIASMTPEELAEYRAKVNAKARENYKKRNKEKHQ